jgi:hypothetical protein
VDITEEDRRVAALASGLLAEWGRSDLEVTPEQTIRWRQAANALPVSGPRTGGRHRVTRYLPTAPAIAAELAIALDTGPRNLDQAILTVFGDAATNDAIIRPADEGVRNAYIHYLQGAEDRMKPAWLHRGKKRSEIPRRFRMPVAGSRQQGAHLVTDTLLASMLGKELPHGEAGAEITVGQFLPAELTGRLGEDERATAVSILAGLNLAALRRAIKKADLDRVFEAVRCVAITTEYAESLRRLCALAPAETPPQLPPPIDLLVVAAGAPAFNAVRGLKGGLMYAVTGLTAYARVTTRSGIRELEDATIAMEAELPRLRAALALADHLPAPWKCAMAPGYAAPFMAALHNDERQRVIKTVREWMDSHPEEGAALIPDSEALPPGGT